MRNQYVLLTCVGASDPVRGCHDGGMLHIMRHYRPYAVYLYISPEMKAEEERDNRYEKAFVRMREKLEGYDPKIVKEYGNVQDVSDLDAVAEPLVKLMRRIQEEENVDVPGSRKSVLVNLSSGSPQMKTVLMQFPLDLKYHAKGIQVKNYEKRSGSSTHTTDRKHYDVDLELELNEDEEPGAANRCVEHVFFYRRRRDQIQRIQELLKKRDYSALDNAHEDLPVPVKQLVHHLSLRIALKREDAEKEAKKLKLGFELYPANLKKAAARSDFREVSEFYLLLENLRVTGRYTELTLRLNPFVIRMQLQFLRTHYEGFEYLLEKRNRHGQVFCPEKLRQRDPQLREKLDSELGQAAEERPVSIHLLNALIRQLPVPEDAKELFQKCEALNADNRNEAAHGLCAVQQDDITAACGCTPKQLLGGLRQLLQALYPECVPVLFDIYERCNRFILSTLEEEPVPVGAKPAAGAR